MCVSMQIAQCSVNVHVSIYTIVVEQGQCSQFVHMQGSCKSLRYTCGIVSCTRKLALQYSSIIARDNVVAIVINLSTYVELLNALNKDELVVARVTS
jgi:hypothetical protein